MRIGDTVKVIRSSDAAVPVQKQFMNQTGKITQINRDQPTPISVDFGELGGDSFWSSELRRIKE